MATATLLPHPECHGLMPVSPTSPLTGGLTHVAPANSLSRLGMSYRDLSPVSHRLAWSAQLTVSVLGTGPMALHFSTLHSK